jgi:serine O-acetyltransferase
MTINIETLEIQLHNFFQLQVECKATGDHLKYAFYLYKDHEIIEKLPYSSSPTMSFNLQDKGVYSVRVYIKDKFQNKMAETSSKIKFNGFKDKGIVMDKPEVAIYGVSRIGAAVKAILETKYKIAYFVDEDEEKWGQLFFGIKIVGLSEIESIENIKIVVADNYLNRDERYDIYNQGFVPDNLVTKTMYELSLMELYKISKYCYQTGLINGAKLIKSFIHFKFNSVVPYTAEIGEGTRFGYGGIGVVVHAKAKIGENCVIGQNVTIGSRGEAPVIGNNVFISPGAKCIGGKIGNNVIVGANAVVTKDIPDNCVVAGVPAKIISTEIEKYSGYIK